MNNRNLLFWLEAIPILLLLLFMAIVFANRANHSEMSYSTFQMYRIVENNLDSPEVTHLLSMTHPAESDQKHFYTTMITPGYQWWITLWAKIKGFNVLQIRYASVAAYMLLYIFSLILMKAVGLRHSWYLGLILLAPGMPLFAIACDPVLISILSAFCLMAIYLKSDQLGETKTTVFSFLAGFFVVFNLIVSASFLFFFQMLLLASDRVCKDDRIAKSWLHYFSPLLGGLLASAITLLIRFSISEKSLSFIEYFQVRANPQMGLFSPSTILYVNERLWSFGSLSFPLFLLMLICFSLLLSKKDYYRSAPGRLFLIFSFAYYGELIFFAKTTIGHHFFIYNYLFLTTVVFGWLFENKAFVPWPRFFKIFLGFFLVMQSLFLYKKDPFWIDQSNPVDKTLENLSQNDFLIRDEDHNTWPLQMNSPEKTIYLDHNESWMRGMNNLGERVIQGYEKSYNSIYHIQPVYQDWKDWRIPKNANCYFITKRKDLPYPIVAKDRGYQIYQVLSATREREDQ